MELPGILHESFTVPGEGIIELCPDAYDLGSVSEMLATALVECEQLVLQTDGRVKSSDR